MSVAPFHDDFTENSHVSRDGQLRPCFFWTIERGPANFLRQEPSTPTMRHCRYRRLLTKKRCFTGLTKTDPLFLMLTNKRAGSKHSQDLVRRGKRTRTRTVWRICCSPKFFIAAYTFIDRHPEATPAHFIQSQDNFIGSSKRAAADRLLRAQQLESSRSDVEETSANLLVSQVPHAWTRSAPCVGQGARGPLHRVQRSSRARTTTTALCFDADKPVDALAVECSRFRAVANPLPSPETANCEMRGPWESGTMLISTPYTGGGPEQWGQRAETAG
jgi:hypothetical protein